MLCADSDGECSDGTNGICRCKSGYYDDNGNTMGGTCQPSMLLTNLGSIKSY